MKQEVKQSLLLDRVVPPVPVPTQTLAAACPAPGMYTPWTAAERLAFQSALQRLVTRHHA